MRVVLHLWKKMCGAIRKKNTSEEMSSPDGGRFTLLQLSRLFSYDYASAYIKCLRFAIFAIRSRLWLLIHIFFDSDSGEDCHREKISLRINIGATVPLREYIDVNSISREYRLCHFPAPSLPSIL